MNHLKKNSVKVISHYRVYVYIVKHNYILGGMLFTVRKAQLHVSALNVGHLQVVPNIQSVSRLEDIIAGGDFLGLCDQKSSYKHVSDFGRLRSYDRLKLRGEGNDY
jgi:hypothetical protein